MNLTLTPNYLLDSFQKYFNRQRSSNTIIFCISLCNENLINATELSKKWINNLFFFAFFMVCFFYKGTVGALPSRSPSAFLICRKSKLDFVRCIVEVLQNSRLYSLIKVSIQNSLYVEGYLMNVLRTIFIVVENTLVQNERKHIFWRFLSTIKLYFPKTMAQFPLSCSPSKAFFGKIFKKVLDFVFCIRALIHY